MDVFGILCLIASASSLPLLHNSNQVNLGTEMEFETTTSTMLIHVPEVFELQPFDKTYKDNITLKEVMAQEPEGDFNDENLGERGDGVYEPRKMDGDHETSISEETIDKNNGVKVKEPIHSNAENELGVSPRIESHLLASSTYIPELKTQEKEEEQDPADESLNYEEERPNFWLNIPEPPVLLIRELQRPIPISISPLSSLRINWPYQGLPVFKYPHIRYPGYTIVEYTL